MATCFPLCIAPDLSVHAILQVQDCAVFIGAQGEWRAPQLPQRLQLYPFVPAAGQATYVYPDARFFGPQVDGPLLYDLTEPNPEFLAVQTRIAAQNDGEARLRTVAARLANADLVVPAPFDGWRMVSDQFPRHLHSFGAPAAALYYALRISMTHLDWLKRAARMNHQPPQPQTAQDKVADFLSVLSDQYTRDR